MIDPSMRNRTVYSSQLGQMSDQKLAIFPAPHSGAATLHSTDQTSQANLRKLNFTNTLYQLALAYYQVLLQQLNSIA